MMLLVKTFETVPVEWPPRTRWCAAQAVLYRVGHPRDPFPARGRAWTAAEQEMLSKRYLPRLGGHRCRWIGVVCMEELADLGMPLHERPAFLRFAYLSQFMPGGGAIEAMSDLGSDPLSQATAVSFLLDVAGTPGLDRQHELPGHDRRTGTFTVGRLTTDLSDGLKAMLRWRDLLRRGVAGSALEDHLRTLRAAVNGMHGRQPIDLNVPLFGLAPPISGIEGRDLSYEAAKEFATETRLRGFDPVQAAEALQLAGYLNQSENRNWYPANARAAGGWT